MGVEKAVNRRLGARWGMIADDLTGACDAAVAFARHGFETRVLLAADSQAAADPDLTVLSTDSRDDPPEVAAAKVSAACLWIKQRGIAVVFKKIDSVLRGNIREEIEALMTTGGFRSAVMTPAFPALGRTVRDGKLRVFGREHETGTCLTTMFSGMPGIRVTDAETEDDLLSAARAALSERHVPLLAGSGGLAAALAQVLASEEGMSVREKCVPHSKQPPWLVIGTDHPATLAQLEHLKQAVPLRQAGGREVLEAIPPQSKQAVALLTVPPDRFEAKTLRPLLEAIHHSQIGSLVVSGGDTARLLAGVIEAQTIRLGGEVLPGIPWGRIEGGLADGMTIVTKSGGFGEPNALTTVVKALWREGE